MYTAHPTCIVRDDGTVIPMDIENADFQEYENWLSIGNEPDYPPPLSFSQRVSVLLARVDGVLNDAARKKGYDDIRSAALRAGYPGPFHDEGAAFATWMDATYAACYQLLAQVQAGEIEEPDATALMNMLPEPPTFD